MVTGQIREQQRMGIALSWNNNTMDENILTVTLLVLTNKSKIIILLAFNEELS